MVPFDWYDKAQRNFVGPDLNVVFRRRRHFSSRRDERSRPYLMYISVEWLRRMWKTVSLWSQASARLGDFFSRLGCGGEARRRIEHGGVCERGAGV